MYACLDMRLPDECPSGNDSECPLAPSRAYGECLDERGSHPERLGVPTLLPALQPERQSLQLLS